MKVKVLKEFTGYPNGKKTVFATGEQTIDAAYVKSARLKEKGLVRIPSLTQADP